MSETCMYCDEWRHDCNTLYARVAELERELDAAKHCKDCCCARSWDALEVTTHTGMSIVEHIEQLKQQLATATAQATFTQHRFDDAIGAIDRLTKENADLRLALIDGLNKKKGVEPKPYPLKDE